MATSQSAQYQETDRAWALGWTGTDSNLALPVTNSQYNEPRDTQFPHL